MPRAAEEVKKRIGYTIQSTELFRNWRVEDSIATVPRLLSVQARGQPTSSC